MTALPTKSIIRQQCRQLRRSLSTDDQRKASEQVCQRIQNLECYQGAQRIGLYKATEGELDLSLLWQLALSQGKQCYFPVLNNNKTLRFLPATLDTVFVRNKYDIEEPVIDLRQASDFQDLDVFFLPLVAFDSFGTRLGMGQGYYDRTLCSLSHSIFIGVAYDFQHQSYIEPSPWDVGLQATVTPTTIYWSQI